MRPDLDDFEDLTPEGDEPRARAMSWVVLGVAIAGFAALAYYAYQSGTQSVGDGSMMVVEADTGPLKETPAAAGGEEFPHKDKTIYDAISPYRVDAPKKVEKLLPESEEPVIPEPAESTENIDSTNVAPAKKEVATTFVNKEVAEDAGSEIETQEVAEVPVAEVAKPEPKKEAVKAEPKEEPKKEVVKAEPKKPAPAASGGDYKIQLGAFTSDAEAEAAWKKISAKHGLSGSHSVMQAQVNGKTWYRLRASGYASANEAKAACTKLSAAKQPCMSVGK